jgi:hypothetical protein
MKYGSEGDKGWDTSSPDAQWSGSSDTVGGASQDCATHAPWMTSPLSDYMDLISAQCR